MNRATVHLPRHSVLLRTDRVHPLSREVPIAAYSMTSLTSLTKMGRLLRRGEFGRLLVGRLALAVLEDRNTFKRLAVDTPERFESHGSRRLRATGALLGCGGRLLDGFLLGLRGGLGRRLGLLLDRLFLSGCFACHHARDRQAGSDRVGKAPACGSTSGRVTLRGSPRKGEIITDSSAFDQLSLNGDASVIECRGCEVQVRSPG